MPELKTFRAFFSYAHHDAETDPELIPVFARALENRVNAKLANVRFAIWRDKENLRLGNKWSQKIEAELRRSDIFILLLTPRWIESEYCRKEYIIFEEVESAHGVGECVAPIIIRKIDRQERHFTSEQKSVYEQLKSRQYQQVLVVDFLKLSAAERTALIDTVADDIEGMIERQRVFPATIDPSQRLSTRAHRTRSFDAGAQNYERVDFVTDGEVVLKRRESDGPRDVLVHVGFVERLYVQSKYGRIEFGVRRAFVSISNDGPGRLSKIDELKGATHLNTCYYATLHESPTAVTICIDPADGRTSLADLPLPPAQGENYLSKIATASAETQSERVKAELIVSLDIEGLFITDDKHKIPPRTANAINAIMDVAKTKVSLTEDQTVDRIGQFRRLLPVRERP